MRALFVLTLFCVTFEKSVGAQNSSDCGDTTFSEPSGTISSPNYPSDYDNNLACSYIIQVSNANSTVVLTFQAFKTELEYDYVQISCASGNSFNSLQYSNDELPPVLTVSSCYRVVIEFFTDSSETQSGFTLNYEVLEGTISGGFSTKPSNFFAPFSSVYSNSHVVIFNCTSKSGYHPSWLFVSLFDHKLNILTYKMCVVSSPYDVAMKTESYGPGSCNLIISAVERLLWNYAGMAICTDSTMRSSAAVFIPYILEMSLNPANGKQTLSDMGYLQGGELTCSLDFSLNRRYGDLDRNQTTVFQFVVLESYWLKDNRDVIPGINTSNAYSTTIYTTASSNVLSSYTCNFNISCFFVDHPMNFTAVLSNSTPKLKVSSIGPLGGGAQLTFTAGVGAAVLIMILIIAIVFLLARLNRTMKTGTTETVYEEPNRSANTYDVINGQMDDENYDKSFFENNDNYEFIDSDCTQPLPGVFIEHHRSANSYEKINRQMANNENSDNVSIGKNDNYEVVNVEGVRPLPDIPGQPNPYTNG